MYNDGDTFRSFSHQIGCLLKYIEFNHAWHKEGTMSVNKLIYAIKRNLVDRYGKYFISVITGSSSLGDTKIYRENNEYANRAT